MCSNNGIWNKLTRRKIIDINETTTLLKRVLSTVDLTLLGIGSTLGIGIYVLAGAVAKNDAGPAVVISFLVAALASVLAGLCYAEFGARVPKAGSAYVYSYVCVGELIAFIVGWNLIMEYVIGVASVAKGYSGYVDSLFHGAMKSAFITYLPINAGFLSNYFDVFAFAITLTITFVLAFGVKESSLFNNIFTGLNLLVVIFVVIAGGILAKPSNWAIDVSNLNLTQLALENPDKKIGELGKGGFAPFGFAGIMKGAATCFYGFVGFDCIATTGEEAKNPQRSIPLAIIFSLLFIFLAYFGISTVITMMVPYYLQDADAPLPEAFTYCHFEAGKWIVSIGALFGLSTSLLGSMFPMPRVIYAMASDGLLFAFLAKVHPKSQTPLAATFIAGGFGAFMAALFDLEALIDMMSIGTLTAYTLVAVCVLVLRYRNDEEETNVPHNSTIISPKSFSCIDYLSQALNKNNLTIPTTLSSSYAGWTVFTYCIYAIGFCTIAIFADEQLMNGDAGYIILISLIGLLLLCSLFSLTMQPVSTVKLSFKVPLVPLIPGMSILTNIYLIMKLTGPTWIRFGIWLFIGMLIYLYCLCTGASDKAYAANLEDTAANKRKYSKISVAGINSTISSSDSRLSGNSARLNPGEINYTPGQNINLPIFKGPMETIEEMSQKNLKLDNTDDTFKKDRFKVEGVPLDEIPIISSPILKGIENLGNDIDDIEFKPEEKAAEQVVDDIISMAQKETNEIKNQLSKIELENLDSDTNNQPIGIINER